MVCPHARQVVGLQFQANRQPILLLLADAASLPVELKLRGETGKYLLREAYREDLPESVLKRPKMGFGVPVDHWLRHELRSKSYEILLDRRAARGYFRPEAVQQLLAEHDSGRANHQFLLWALLMLELWHVNFVDARRSAAATVA